MFLGDMFYSVWDVYEIDRDVVHGRCLNAVQPQYIYFFRLVCEKKQDSTAESA